MSSLVNECEHGDPLAAAAGPRSRSGWGGALSAKTSRGLTYLPGSRESAGTLHLWSKPATDATGFSLPGAP
jgi:hypothetical protein